MRKLPTNLSVGLLNAAFAFGTALFPALAEDNKKVAPQNASEFVSLVPQASTATPSKEGSPCFVTYTAVEAQRGIRYYRENC
jgi:hypothetical protein